jgi:chemotaxis protein MotB
MAAMLMVFILALSGTLLKAQQNFEEKQAELQEKEAIIAQEEATILEQQKQIDEIVGVRLELIETLRDAFENTDLSVKIDSQTGAITFNSNLLFEVDESTLRQEGMEFLDEFLPRYFAILLGDEFSPYVSEIIIEGHTDTNGSYMYNLQLSQNRALAVASYCLDDKQNVLSEEQREELRVLMTANGRSWSAPIYGEDGSIDMNASRRVEIKFRLKDDEMMAQIAEAFKEIV